MPGRTKPSDPAEALPLQGPHPLADQVMRDALEGGVLLLLQDEDNISRHHIRLAAACFTAQDDLGVVLVPLLYVHLKHLLFCHQAL